MENSINIIEQLEDEISPRRAYIIGLWKDQHVDFMIKHQLDSLELNSVRGWQESNLNFLLKLKFLKSFKLSCSGDNISNAINIQKLINLEDISLSDFLNVDIDFTLFKKLKSAYVYWWPGASSILDTYWLNSLYIYNFKMADYSPIENMVNLTSLNLLSRTFTDCRHLVPMAKLEKLVLTDCRNLENVHKISHLKNLKYIDLDSVKPFGNLEFLKPLNNLEKISLHNVKSIESIAPLAEIKSLKHIWITGNTTIEDGDLSPIYKLPNLEKLALNNRRHYSHKVKDIRNDLGIY